MKETYSSSNRMEENMLLEKDPCEGCIVIMLCEQMCPKVIKFYSERVRKRPKHEVEAATGYYWDDDYTDSDTGVVYEGLPIGRISKKPVKIFYKPVKSKSKMLNKIINFIDNLKERN